MNIFTAVVLFIVMIFTKVILYFLSTRVAVIKDMGNQKEKGYTKNYFNFLFLQEHNKKDSYYSKHQLVLNLIKDPILGLFLVFFSEIPTLQIGGAFVITSVYFALEVYHKPSTLKDENTRNILSNGIYAATNLMFLILHLTEGKLTQD